MRLKSLKRLVRVNVALLSENKRCVPDTLPCPKCSSLPNVGGKKQLFPLSTVYCDVALRPMRRAGILRWIISIVKINPAFENCLVCAGAWMRREVTLQGKPWRTVAHSWVAAHFLQFFFFQWHFFLKRKWRHYIVCVIVCVCVGAQQFFDLFVELN